MEFFSQNFHFLHSRTDFNFNLTIFSPNFSWVKNKSKQNTITKFSFEKTKIKQSKPIPSIWISLPKIKKTRIHEYLIHWYCLLSLFISILLLYYYITDHLLYSSFIFILFLCHFECIHSFSSVYTHYNIFQIKTLKWQTRWVLIK